MSVVTTVERAVPTLHVLDEPFAISLGLHPHVLVTAAGKLRGVFLTDNGGEFVRGKILGPHGDVHAAVTVEGFCALLLLGETLR